MSKVLSFTRWLIAAVTTLHIKGLKVAVAAADRAADKAVTVAEDANRVRQLAKQAALSAEQAVEDALHAANSVYTAAKEEVLGLRPSEAARF